ncbi:hypothetical protein SAMN05660493_00472 [Epilithonimonas bovis DSM 19482]|uniref:Uncharacterized protein n=1 Tax=Epilithonimonas bovis DSM 19482 TaxID=1121284 RepID=A0A1U7PSX4_9FLAO|nr:hypothetical protein [Epilithonimonas bovis]SIT95807.1 hypothetical protein SAMN05660493_00472 [Epilithonimonas bovis DSM 19482]
MNKNSTLYIDAIRHLKKVIIQNFGKQISTATDCALLSDRIAKETGFSISAQTIRRFFGLIKSDSQTSDYVVNKLAKFCGYRDFSGFLDSFSNTDLKEFFKEDDTSKDYWRKSEELCLNISESPELLANVHQYLLSYPMARKFFLEHHPMRDLLGTVYDQYFLHYLKYNNGNEGKIFAYGFLFLSAFLQQNHELMKMYFQQIKNTEIQKNIHVIPAGLKFGVELLYADCIGDEKGFKKTFLEMKKWRIHYISASEKSVCSFEYSVLELLIFTNRIKEIEFLIKNQTFQQYQDQFYVPEDRKITHDEVWKILCAVAYEKMEKYRISSDYLQSVNLENIGVGWKNYYSLLYYQTLLKLTENKETIETQTKFENLANKTNFCYFKDCFEKEISNFAV